jgi:non-heme chloroperoxidase
MNLRRPISTGFLLLLWLPLRVHSQEIPWHDPSPHTVQFVDVDHGVKLEVLDWGGSGRPLVFLAGLGNTAHVFDDFAPKLTSEYHVYGITRRGLGASGSPAPEGSNYSADRLGDDVLAVIDALKIDHPVLVGHPFAGEELSSIGTRHPERIAALIYLDANDSYAYYDPAQGDLIIDMYDLQRKLQQLQPPGNLQDDKHKQLMADLLQQTLPTFENDLKSVQASQQMPSLPSPPAPTPSDLATFAAFRSWQIRNFGYAVPEAELRQQFASKTDGGVGQQIPRDREFSALIAGGQKYAASVLPILAICGNPPAVGPFADKYPAARDAEQARMRAHIEMSIKSFETAMPQTRVVVLPLANHYLFLSNESDVLREMRAFLVGLHQ